VKLPDTEGDDSAIASLQGDAGAIAGKILGLKAAIPFKITPHSHGGRCHHARGENKADDDKGTHEWFSDFLKGFGREELVVGRL